MANSPRILDAADPSRPALSNSAVAHCTTAWEKAYRATYEETGSEYESEKSGATAFRASLPPLTSRGNCRDFVAQGVLPGAIDDKQSTKLLYGVQIALSAIAADEKSREAAGYARANLSKAEPRRVQKSPRPRSRKS